MYMMLPRDKQKGKANTALIAQYLWTVRDAEKLVVLRGAQRSTTRRTKIRDKNRGLRVWVAEVSTLMRPHTLR